MPSATQSPEKMEEQSVTESPERAEQQAASLMTTPGSPEGAEESGTAPLSGEEDPMQISQIISASAQHAVSDDEDYLLENEATTKSLDLPTDTGRLDEDATASDEQVKFKPVRRSSSWTYLFPWNRP